MDSPAVEPVPSGAEQLAELMAWHGMARYADPDDLAAHVRPTPPAEPSEPSEPSDSDRTAPSVD